MSEVREAIGFTNVKGSLLQFPEMWLVYWYTDFWDNRLYDSEDAARKGAAHYAKTYSNVRIFHLPGDKDEQVQSQSERQE